MKRVLALILTALTGVYSFAAPSSLTAKAAVSLKITHICANPGADCNTEVGISWCAAVDCTSCVLEYKPAASSGWDDVVAVEASYNDTDWQYFVGNSYADASGAVFSEGNKFLNYNLDLKGLEPATRYKYRIKDNDGNYSAARYFATSGKEEYNIVWISDFHTYTPSGTRLSAATSAVAYAVSQAEGGVDAVFSSGDTVAYGGSYYFWRQVYDQSWIKNFLYIDINGNHDNMNNTNTNNTFNYFRIMHNNPANCYLGDSDEPFEPGVVYYFMYNDILWFVFDNETMGSNRAEIQEWAGSVIESMEGKYKYLFISEHYQWFYGDTGKDSHYGNWSDFCDKYNVDIAFGANNHVYARTYKLYNGEVVDDDSPVGTYYIQAPSSDCARGNTSTFCDPATYNSDIIAYRYKNFTNPTLTHGVSLISVTTDGIRINLYGDDAGSAQSPEFELKDTVFVCAKRSSPANPTQPSETVHYGDVNGDGKVNSLDASAVLKHLCSLTQLDTAALTAADVNADGTVNTLDAAMILKYDAKLIDKFTAEEK